MKNIFNKPLSCQECFVVRWPTGEKYVNNVGYCHTKYGHIVTSGAHLESLSASG